MNKVAQDKEGLEFGIHLYLMYAMADYQDATSLQSEKLQFLFWSSFSLDG